MRSINPGCSFYVMTQKYICVYKIKVTRVVVCLFIETHIFAYSMLAFCVLLCVPENYKYISRVFHVCDDIEDLFSTV